MKEKSVFVVKSSESPRKKAEVEETEAVVAHVRVEETFSTIFTQEFIQQFADARLLIVDEISFASKEDFQKMEKHLKIFMKNRLGFYGGMNMVFAGDFSQMEPVKRAPVYDVEVPEFHDLVNAFVDLKGMHRFGDDVDWGEINMRIRDGACTVADIMKINQTCLVSDSNVPPEGTPCATHTNKERDAINTGMYVSALHANAPANGGKLESAIMVFMDTLAMADSHKVWHEMKSNRERKVFWEKCGEDDCKVGGENAKGRVDPVLKLYPNCPLMYTQNSNVLSGQANGSRVRFERLYMKELEHPFSLKLACGTVINAVFASQVHSIQVRHENPRIIPQVFEVQARQSTFSARFEFRTEMGAETVWQSMRGTQFPLVSNSATTGHKLQGATLAALLVSSWNYRGNWAYVVLSRVRTMKGLYLTEPLDTTDLSKYEKNENMAAMMQKFTDTKLLQCIDDAVYAEMEEFDESFRISDVHNA